ncbi:MAG: hypothetical protein QXF52_06575 [Thermoproteota archaeon]
MKTSLSLKRLTPHESGRSQSGSSLTWPRAFSRMILCSILATSFLVNTAASGLIEIESMPALTRNSVN